LLRTCKGGKHRLSRCWKRIIEEHFFGIVNFNKLSV
jgi:hypothetical protein